MSGEVVPFGKYKGQPVEVLVADQSYREWLLSQPWSRDRLGNVYQLILNYGGPPQDTPEHNEMQASFLNDEQCLRLARVLYPDDPFDSPPTGYSAEDAALHNEFEDHLTVTVEAPSVIERQFEADGWDVVFKIEVAVLMLVATSLPDCRCRECYHSNCSEPTACVRGEAESRWHCRHYDHNERISPDDNWLSKPRYLSRVEVERHCFPECPWSDGRKADWLLDPSGEQRCYGMRTLGTIRVECKPDLGDDFPSVLRQVSRYRHDKHGGRRCVVVRRHAFERVTWDQVVDIFSASGIVVLEEGDRS